MSVSMTLSIAVKSALAKYVTFSGRARRSEYWYFALFQLILLLVAVGVEMISRGAGSVLYVIVVLGLALPNIAVTIRRFHDLDRSGWWYFLGFVPLIGGIIILIWFCSPGTAGPNRYGLDPRAAAIPAVF
jgi:uncharacterized membrane protein YhaH (DUF805 family)